MLDQAGKGQISNARWLNTWTFNGQEGQVITITVERSGGTLIPYLEVKDANGSTLNSAYAADTHDTVTMEYYTLPATAAYQIVVSRDSGSQGYTTGTYNLTITAAAPAQ